MKWQKSKKAKFKVSNHKMVPNNNISLESNKNVVKLSF